MTQRTFVVGEFAATVLSAGCSNDADTRDSTADASGYSVPRTSWGNPDLRGMRPIINLISTPLQRPEQYGTREMLTDEEYAESQGRLEARNERYETEISSNQDGNGALGRVEPQQRCRPAHLAAGLPGG